MSHNSMMYLLIALIIATLTSASTIQKTPCTSDECRLAELGLLFPQELAEQQQPRFSGYQDRPASYKFKRDYDFVRFGRSAPSKKASYDYIRFGRK